MTVSLSADELQAAQAMLRDYGPAQLAIASLQQHQGDLEASLEELVVEAAGSDLRRRSQNPAPGLSR
jgi:hypothetical protein